MKRLVLRLAPILLAAGLLAVLEACGSAGTGGGSGSVSVSVSVRHRRGFGPAWGRGWKHSQRPWRPVPERPIGPISGTPPDRR